MKGSEGRTAVDGVSQRGAVYHPMRPARVGLWRGPDREGTNWRRRRFPIAAEKCVKGRSGGMCEGTDRRTPSPMEKKVCAQRDFTITVHSNIPHIPQTDRASCAEELTVDMRHARACITLSHRISILPTDLRWPQSRFEIRPKKFGS